MRLVQKYLYRQQNNEGQPSTKGCQPHLGGRLEAVPQAPPKERSRKTTSPKDKEKVKTVQKIEEKPGVDECMKQFLSLRVVKQRMEDHMDDAPPLDHPDIYKKLPDGVWWCKLCGKKATKEHVASKYHLKYLDYPEDIIQEYICDKRPQNDDKKEAPEDEPSLNHRTIFTDATDNPMTYLKITMLERRLKVNRITKEEFRNQHPYGAGHPRRACVGGQAISLNEYAFIMNVTSIPALNGAVALITDYVDGYYSASLLGAHRGQHVDDLRQLHLELIKQDKWPKLYDEDQLLYWDVRGIDNGVSFPNRTRGI